MPAAAGVRNLVVFINKIEKPTRHIHCRCGHSINSTFSTTCKGRIVQLNPLPRRSGHRTCLCSVKPPHNLADDDIFRLDIISDSSDKLSSTSPLTHLIPAGASSAIVVPVSQPLL